MKKVWKKLRNYPELLGIAAICLLVFIIFLYKLAMRQEYVEPGIVTEDMAKESTVDGFNQPEDTVRYMIEALRQGDLDMGLRGFPIDEKILGINVEEVLDSIGEFSANITYMPSQWNEFVPISSAEITKDYTEMFGYMEKAFFGKKVEVEQVHAILPERQLETQYHKDSQQICEMWGADSREEIVVKLKINNKDYAMGMTLLCYDGFWKIDDFSSTLATEEKQIKEKIWLCEEDKYEKLIDEGKEEELTRLLERKIEEHTQDKNQKQKEASPENELLPVNYMLYNSEFAATPEGAIEKFALCVQKNDLSAMMVYTDIYGEEDPFVQELSETLIKQGELAEQIQTFYYYLLGNSFATVETVSLDSLGMTGEEISSSISLEEMQYLDLNSILHIKNNEYAALYYFNGEHYMSGFTMKEYEQGWKIEELSCAFVGLEKGQVKKLAEKEYNSILEDYR